MRKIMKWNSDWQFAKGEDLENAQSEDISLPHTWNALDGQDGGGDYYQGIGWYPGRVFPQCELRPHAKGHI